MRSSTVIQWAESICANYSFEKVSIAPLSIFLMVLIAKINRLKLRHILSEWIKAIRP